MPWKSEAQRRWGHTPAGTRALGGAAKVREWDGATKGMTLPRKTIASAAASLAALQSKGGGREMRAQSKAMSKTKRLKLRRGRKGK